MRVWGLRKENIPISTALIFSLLPPQTFIKIIRRKFIPEITNILSLCASHFHTEARRSGCKFLGSFCLSDFVKKFSDFFEIFVGLVFAVSSHQFVELTKLREFFLEVKGPKICYAFCEGTQNLYAFCIDVLHGGRI